MNGGCGVVIAVGVVVAVGVAGGGVGAFGIIVAAPWLSTD
jgi:hypothetical protein